VDEKANWTETDDFLERLLRIEDPALTAALVDSRRAGLPDIQVSPLQGGLLHLLARSVGAHRILEIGTLGGYSTIWLARALGPGGRLVSLELNPQHAAVARANLARAGVADRAEVNVGPALELLPALAAEPVRPFDFVFIDADKTNSAAYFDWAMRLSRPGTLIVADNVVRAGTIRDRASTDANVQGTQRLLDRVAATEGIVASVMQTVGRKGHDGWAIVHVLRPHGRPALGPSSP
jgi:predicted O-methyltransferase YrrM